MADQEAKKRSRSKNFSAAEVEVIKNGVSLNVHILNAKHCNGESAITKKKQDEVWETVSSSVNAIGHCHRTVSEVKEKWRSLTRKAKAEVTAQKISCQKTGGGPPLPAMSSVMSDIAGIFENSEAFHGIHGAEDAETITIAIGVDNGETHLEQILPETSLLGMLEESADGNVQDTINNSTSNIETSKEPLQQEYLDTTIKQPRSKRSLRELQTDYFQAALANEEKRSKVMDKKQLMIQQQIQTLEKLSSFLDMWQKKIQNEQ